VSLNSMNIKVDNWSHKNCKRLINSKNKLVIWQMIR
jgi:hypothetical protein